jgi:hypothetical protein
MLLREFIPLFSRKEGDTKHPPTIFRAEVVNICGDGGFLAIHDPEIEWPGGLQPQPKLSFSTEIASEKLPEEVRNALDLQGHPDPLIMCFGLRSRPDPEGKTDIIFLSLAEKGAERAIVMSAQLNKKLKWDMVTSIYTPEGESNSPSFQASVFAKTAKLARECAEFELRSKQTA